MWVANHTYGHPHLLPLDGARPGSEIARTQRVLSDITHQEPTLFRPPYGETDDAVRAAAGRLRAARGALDGRLPGLGRRRAQTSRRRGGPP